MNLTQHQTMLGLPLLYSDLWEPAFELGLRECTQLRVVSSMHERKQMMADLSDGFVALPGGIGTYEELLETFTWQQLAFHDKPVGILNVAGFYDHLLAFLLHATNAQFLRSEHND